MPKQPETEWATIGTVVAPFGLHGELKVHLMTDIPDRFKKLAAIHLGPDHHRYPIKGVRAHKGEMIVLKLEGIEDATTAETVRDCELTIPLSALAKLPPDSYYQHDIIGLRVFTLDEREIGTIVDILLTGGNDVYVIKPSEPDGRQILIPATKDTIKEVDLSRKMMYITPIAGLLDEQEAVAVRETETEDEQENEKEGASSIEGADK